MTETDLSGGVVDMDFLEISPVTLVTLGDTFP